MRGQGKVYLRGQTWWIRYWHKNTEYRESAQTSDEKAALRTLKDRLDDLAVDRKGLQSFATPSVKKITIHDLLEALKSDFVQRGKASAQNLSGIKQADEGLRDKEGNILWTAFGDVRALELSPAHVNRFIDSRRADGYANASINRITGIVGQAFALAMRENRITRAPFIKRLPEDNARQGFTDAATFGRIHDNLPDDLKDFAQFAFSTGWRKGEIASLDWSNVQDNDGMIRLRPDQAKSKSGRAVPVTGKLVEIVKRRREARAFDAGGTTAIAKWVFHRDGGLQIVEFRKAWATACRKAGRPGLLFHDLRRSAVSAMVNARVPQLIAMGISGHKTASMFKRYAIGIESEMADAMAATEAYHVAQMAKQPAQQENVRSIAK